MSITPATINIETSDALIDSAQDLEDKALLAQRYSEDGYLFLRGVLEREPLLEVRDALTEVLQSKGIAVPSPEGPRWTGGDPSALDELDFFASGAELRYIENSDVQRVIEKAWGHKPFIWRTVGIFPAFPDDNAFIKIPHQDRFFPDDEADSYATAWLPLTTIDDECGGLTVAVGSHRDGRREVKVLDDMRMRHNADPVKGIRPEDVPEPWTTGHMQPGDMFLFHSLAVHSGLANFSDRIRLALAIRFQRADVEAPPLARYSKLEHVARRKKIREHLEAVGANIELLYVIDDQIVARGLEPSRENVTEILAEQAS